MGVINKHFLISERKLTKIVFLNGKPKYLHTFFTNNSSDKKQNGLIVYVEADFYCVTYHVTKLGCSVIYWAVKEVSNVLSARHNVT